MSIPRIINSVIKKNNISTIFGYSGGSIMPLIDTLYNDDSINLIVNVNEQCVGHAATGYAKSSNRTGVALVTSGPGITNLITPMLDATQDSTPLVVISGQVPLNAIGTDAFQEAPATNISKYVTKWSYQIDKDDDVQEIIERAFFIANDKKKGCVHIDIPKCLMGNNMNINMSRETNTITNSYIPDESIGLVVDIINNSKKPIFYIGQGCNTSYQLLREVCAKGNIPVTTTIHANGVINEYDTLSLGWCGMHGSPVANFAIQSSDCIIALGSRFDDRTTGNIKYYAPEAIKAQRTNSGGIIHVNIEESEINKVVDSKFNFNMDCGLFLSSIKNKIEYKKRNDWFNYISLLKKNKLPKQENKVNGELTMENVLQELNKQTSELNSKKKLIITTGVGNHQMQTYKYIRSQFPKTIISSGSLGVMGCGLPYAIGAKLANDDKVVILVDGDSSFNMTLSDMKTVVENNIPIKIIIMNNKSQMMVQAWEELFFENRIVATENKHNPDYVKLAESYGIKGYSCMALEHLEETIKNVLNANGPILCEFIVEKDICFPLIPPNNALHEMIYNKEDITSSTPPS